MRFIGKAAIASGLCLSLVGAYLGYVWYCEHSAGFRSPDIAMNPACRTIPWTSNAFKGSPLECMALRAEAGRLKTSANLVHRDGEALDIFYRGKLLAHLAPAAPASTNDQEACDSVIFAKALDLYDPESQRPEPIAEITCHQGEFAFNSLVLPDGKFMSVSQAWSSPNGRLLVTGDNRLDSIESDALQIAAWPSRQAIARFRPHCRVKTWQGNTHFSATCFDAHSNTAFDADISLRADGAWHMQGTRWRFPGDATILETGDEEYAPAPWRIFFPLPHHVATVPAQPPHSTENKP